MPLCPPAEPLPRTRMRPGSSEMSSWNTTSLSGGSLYQASATAKLEQAGFTVQSVEKANDGSQTSGTVYATSLTGGESYDKGTTCILTVWGEPETETTTESTTTIGQGIGEAIDNILTPSESD